MFSPFDGGSWSSHIAQEFYTTRLTMSMGVAGGQENCIDKYCPGRRREPGRANRGGVGCGFVWGAGPASRLL
ncbi:MAG: hypothetical protein ACE5F6_13290 [Anaerolineae bacterium]